jgi:hypothetical protein
MSRSPPNQPPLGHAEASSSRASNGKQPAVEDDYSDEEALPADDPLERDLPEQYDMLDFTRVMKADLCLQNIFQEQTTKPKTLLRLRLSALPLLQPGDAKGPRLSSSALSK